MKIVRFPYAEKAAPGGGTVIDTPAAARGAGAELNRSGTHFYMRVPDTFDVAVPFELVAEPYKFDSDPPNTWWLSKDKFAARFTPMEKVRIKIAGTVNRAADPAAQIEAGTVAVVMDELGRAEFVDLTPGSSDRARVAAALDLIKDVQVFGRKLLSGDDPVTPVPVADRLTAILNTPVPPEQRFIK